MTGRMVAGGGLPRGPIAIVLMTVFLDLMGFGLLIPIQPFYAESFGARPATVTLLSATFSLAQFLFAPLVGRLSDRVGRRPVMLLTIAINCAGYLVFGLAGSLATLFAARITTGLGSANLGTAQAIMADLTPPEQRARGMGLIGMAFGLGFIFGPAVGGLLGQYGLAVPAFASAALAAINFVFAAMLLPETRQSEAGVVAADAPSAVRHRLSLAALGEAVRRPGVAQLFWLSLVGTIAFSQMEQVLGLYIERTWLTDGSPAPSSTDHLRAAAALTAYFLIVVGVAIAFVQGLLIGRLARWLGEPRLLQIGTFITAVGLALVPVVGDLRIFGVFLLLGPLLALGTGLTHPSLTSLLSKAAPSSGVGGMLGLGQSLSALGRVVGPSLAGVLFEVHRGVPFWVGAAMMLTCTAVAMTLSISRTH